MNCRGQFSIIAALFVAVILVTTVMVTYSSIRYTSNQDDPQILSAIDETNLALKQVLGFTVGYYGSVLQVTGNSSYGYTLASNYLNSGLENIANIRPEWGYSFNVLNLTLDTAWFMNESYSEGHLTVNYSLTGLGVSGITYSATNRLDVQISSSSSPSQVCLSVFDEQNDSISNLVLQNFKFYNYQYSNFTWQMVNPPDEPVSFSNGTYLVDIPSGINPRSYSIQVQDSRGIMVAASSFSHYTGTLTFNSTFVNSNSYVNSQNSDVDGVTDVGTHSNFAAQQSAPDGVYDNLTMGASSPQTQDYFPTSYNPIGGTTLGSGTVTNLKSDDGNYMTFNSYPTAFSSSSNFGYTSIGSSYQSIENTIIGSVFTLPSSAQAQNIYAYIKAPSTVTFGDTTQHSSTASIMNTIRGNQFSPTYNGVATKISAYIACTSAAKNMKAAIYYSSNNSLLAQSTEQSVSTGTTWVSFTFSSGPNLTAGTTYILVVWSASGSGTANLYYQNGGGNSGDSYSQTYGANFPFQPSFSTVNNQYSIYCTYQPSAKVKAAIYSSTNAFIAGTQELTISSTGWATFPFSSPQPVLAANTNYILVAWSSAGGGFTMAYHTGSSNEGQSFSQTYGNWPASPSFGHNNNEYSIYCSFSVASQFTCTVEFSGSSNTNNWNSILWTIDSLSSTASVGTTFQLYNYQTGQYPASGDGYLTATLGTSLSSSSQTITVNPTIYRDVLGNWKLKFTAVKNTPTQFGVSVDMARYRTAVASYALNIEETWLNLNYTTLQRPVLCIDTGTLGAQSLSIYAWHGGSWQLLSAALVNGWNNVSLSSYVNTGSTNFTLRFASASGLVQYSWLIDSALIRQESDQQVFQSLSATDGVVTAELLQNGTLLWLGNSLQLTSQTIPIPPVPVKSIQVKETINGVNAAVPFQIEDWSSSYTVPQGLTNNATVFGNRQMIVFLINTHVSDFTVWWNGSDQVTQSPLAFTNKYFNDNPSGGTISNGRLKLAISGGFTVTSSVVSTGTASTSTFMRANTQASTYGAGSAYVIVNGSVRDILQQEAEWSNGVPNCPNVYANIVLTLPANATYYTYQLRLMFLSSAQARTISDLCPVKVQSSISTLQTENGTLLSDPIVVNDSGTTYYYNQPSGTMHHWSQFISGTHGAGIMFTDSANQQLYIYDSMAGGVTGALKTSTTAQTIELMPVSTRSVSFLTAMDVMWQGAVATFDGTTPIYAGQGQPGLWVLAELPPTISVVTGN